MQRAKRLVSYNVDISKYSASGEAIATSVGEITGSLIFLAANLSLSEHEQRIFEEMRESANAIMLALQEKNNVVFGGEE